MVTVVPLSIDLEQDNVSTEQDRQDWAKIVARGRSGDLVKGYFESVTGLDSFEKAGLEGEEIRVRPAESISSSVLKVQSLKAIFFVKTFDGNPNYRESQYFAEAPVYPGIWIRVRFCDQEVIEGVVENSIRPFVQPGLLLRLPDLESNNLAVYVVKSSLQEIQILGVNSSALSSGASKANRSL
jgi:hypothetical protein